MLNLNLKVALKGWVIENDIKLMHAWSGVVWQLSQSFNSFSLQQWGFYTRLHKIVIYRTNYIYQAVRQGLWTSFFVVLFSLMFGPNGSEIKKAVPPTNKSQKLWKICWMFLTMILTNLRSTWWVLRFWFSDFLQFLFQNIKFIILPYWEIKSRNYLESERS